jgi:uncharacterized protein DUF4303
MRVIDREALKTTMLAELRAAWASLRGRHPGERFYSFGLYATDLADYLMVTASTEEGLSEVTQRYMTRTGRDATVQRAALRWSPADSPLHAEGDGLLTESDRLRQAGPDPYDDTPEADEAVSLVFDVAIQSLQQLDREGTFGEDLSARSWCWASGRAINPTTNGSSSWVCSTRVRSRSASRARSACLP